MEEVQSEFEKFKGLIDATLMESEPELVLVLELANKVDDLTRAVNVAGLEWLGEWDIDIEADEDFPAQGGKTMRNGRLFVSMANQQGMNELLALWSQWEKKQELAHGKTKWRDIFACLKKIRPWGIEETLVGTGMKDYFENLSDEEIADFQIECFYRQNEAKRRDVEGRIRHWVSAASGELISGFIDMGEIAFHAVKARMPAKNVKSLLGNSDNPKSPNLFIFPSVMYFRQTGQSITTTVEDGGGETQYPQTSVEHPPVAAILDGAPNLQHKALHNRVNFDDPFDLAQEYQLGERRHGTAMASLIIHGDQSSSDEEPKLIRSKIHHVAVMQPDANARNFGEKVEHFPVDCFYEDRIEQAVRRIMEHDGEVEAQAPTVKIINLSLGDPTRPFIHTPSPWARLLDWLAWKYRVLFCVSAGNYTNSYRFAMPYSEYQSKTAEEKTQLLLKAIQGSLPNRRLLAPAESINALTVGALHQDESGDYYLGQRVDLLPDDNLLSPISRLGHGFRRSIKPEIYFPGGRQLYQQPLQKQNEDFEISESLQAPGQQVAWDSEQEGEFSNTVFSRGASNATALATRAGIQIHDVLNQLNNQDQKIPDTAIAVLIKALLVHGSVQDRQAKRAVECLKNQHNSRQFKTVLVRYLGYGAVNVNRVLGCTEQRGTVLGFGEVDTEQIHEYRFPIPGAFSEQKTFRRMVITLAWFSPINPRHRYLREAKLEIKPAKKWDETPLKIKRTDGEHNQVKRGTVQHEVLEGEDQLASFQEDEEIVLQIICKKDATDKLEEKIPYGMAVTLEAAEASNIPVYTKIRERLPQQIKITET